MSISKKKVKGKFSKKFSNKKIKSVFKLYVLENILIKTSFKLDQSKNMIIDKIKFAIR